MYCMSDTTLLKQIGELIDKKLAPMQGQIGSMQGQIGSMQKQLDTVELKVEAVNKRVEQAQEETIEVLTDIIQTGYNLHEKRIKRLEKQAGFS